MLRFQIKRSIRLRNIEMIKNRNLIIEIIKIKVNNKIENFKLRIKL